MPLNKGRINVVSINTLNIHHLIYVRLIPISADGVLSERRPQPETVDRRLVVVAVISRIENRLITQGRVHVRKYRESVKHLQVFFVSSSTLRHGRPGERHTNEIMFKLTRAGWVIEEKMY
jgi:hypothetical protein